MKITTPRQFLELIAAFTVLNGLIEDGIGIKEIHELVAPDALLIAAGRLAESNNLPEQFQADVLKLSANIINAYKGE